MKPMIFHKYVYRFYKYTDIDTLFAQHAFVKELTEDEIQEFLLTYANTYCLKSELYTLDGKL